MKLKSTLKSKKRLRLFILIVCFFIYTGLYLHKIVRYYYYGPLIPFGVKDSYILTKFYEEKNRFPDSESELRNFILDNDTLFTANVMAEYLTKYDFHMKYFPDKGIFIFYDDGLNYKDDNLKVISNSSNTNFFNFLFVEGDVILFYSDTILQKDIPLYKNVELPKNIIITTETE